MADWPWTTSVELLVSCVDFLEWDEYFGVCYIGWCSFIMICPRQIQTNDYKDACDTHHLGPSRHFFTPCIHLAAVFESLVFGFDCATKGRKSTFLQINFRSASLIKF